MHYKFMIVVMFLGGHLFSISILLLITTDILLMMLHHLIRKFKDYRNNITNVLSTKYNKSTHISQNSHFRNGHMALDGIQTCHPQLPILYFFQHLQALHKGFSSFPREVACTIIGERSVTFVILIGLQCSCCRLVLVTKHNITKRCPKSFLAVHT